MTKKIIILCIVVLAFLVSFIWWRGRVQQPERYTGPIESVRVGTVKEYSTLVLIAERQGFFRDNGLAVAMTEYTSGAPSLKSLLKNEVDVSIGSDFSGVSLNDPRLKIVSAIFDALNVFEIVARKDRGILIPSDLKGKKIGLTKRTMGEFFLGTFLIFNNLSLEDVILVDDAPAGLEEAIDKGKVDAVINFQPYAYDIKKKLGKNGAVFNAQGDQSLYALLYTNQSFADKHPEAIRRFVQALVQAERFVHEHPEEARGFLAERLHYPEDYKETILSKFNFRLSLSRSLLIAMENETRWAIANKLIKQTTIPNYLDAIYSDPLLNAKPEAVSIIR